MSVECATHHVMMSNFLQRQLFLFTSIMMEISKIGIQGTKISQSNFIYFRRILHEPYSNVFSYLPALERLVFTFLTRFLMRFRVQNATYPDMHDCFFPEASRGLERKYHLLFEGTVPFYPVSANFAGILWPRYATKNPCGVGWGGFCIQNRIKTAFEIA